MQRRARGANSCWELRKGRTFNWHYTYRMLSNGSRWHENKRNGLLSPKKLYNKVALFVQFVAGCKLINILTHVRSWTLAGIYLEILYVLC